MSWKNDSTRHGLTKRNLKTGTGFTQREPNRTMARVPFAQKVPKSGGKIKGKLMRMTDPEGLGVLQDEESILFKGTKEGFKKGGATVSHFKAVSDKIDKIKFDKYSVKVDDSVGIYAHATKGLITGDDEGDDQITFDGTGYYKAYIYEAIAQANNNPIIEVDGDDYQIADNEMGKEYTVEAGFVSYKGNKFLIMKKNDNYYLLVPAHKTSKKKMSAKKVKKAPTPKPKVEKPKPAPKAEKPKKIKMPDDTTRRVEGWTLNAVKKALREGKGKQVPNSVYQAFGIELITDQDERVGRYEMEKMSNRAKVMEEHEDIGLALPPGWRISDSGRLYKETRPNRSDIPGTKY